MRRLGLGVLMVAMASVAVAQTAGSYRVAGTVASAIDSHPLQQATVELLDENQQKTIQTTTSDEYGKFAFTGVPAGSFVLQGSARGYLTTKYQDHEGYSTGIITGTGADAESLALTLRPQSTISGTVVDEVSDPVQGALVHLFRQTHDFGDSRIVPAGSASTDDEGRFEIVRLAPGTYFLAVTATPWYAVHPNPQNQQRQPIMGFVDSVDPALDVAYPVTYYPGVTDAAHASPIVLRGGDDPEVTLQLQPQPALTITIPHAMPKPGQPDFMPMLQTSMFGHLQPAMGQESRQGDGKIVVTGVAPGDYYVSDPRRPETDAGGLTPLHATDGPVTAAAPAAGMSHIHVILKMDDGSSAAGIWITMIHRKDNLPGAREITGKKGEADLDVSPGDYWFQISGDFGVRLVREVRSGTDALAGNDVHIGSGAHNTFTITAAVGRYRLKGLAQNGGKAAPGTFMLLIPTNDLREPHTIFEQQSDLDGSFYFDNVPAGAYRLLAIEDGWGVEWRDPSLLSRYLAGSTAVQIADSATRVQTLSAPVAVQPK